MLKLGNSAINKAYLGDTEIKKAYLGDALVWSKELPSVSFAVIAQSTANLLILTTDSSNYTIDWGDGTVTSYASASVYRSHTYISPFTGDVRILHSDLSQIRTLQSTLGTYNFSNVSSLTSLTNLRLINNSFTGDMSDVKLLTSLTYLYLKSSSFTGDMSDVKLLTSLTYLYLSSNSFTGDMGDVKLLTSLDALYLIGNSFTYTYATITINFSTFFLRLQTGELSAAADIDQLFIDLDSVATSKSGSFDLRSSGASAPTATSLSARNSLIAKGRAILKN